MQRATSVVVALNSFLLGCVVGASVGVSGVTSTPEYKLGNELYGKPGVVKLPTIHNLSASIIDRGACQNYGGVPIETKLGTYKWCVLQEQDYRAAQADLIDKGFVLGAGSQ